jgi:hypothetical protein
LAVGVGCYVILGLFSLEDLVPLPADRNAEVIPIEPTSPAAPASIDEELDYIVAKRLASLEGWRAFLDAHPSGAYAKSAGAEVARRLGASAATSGAAPSNNGRGYGLSERLASVASYAQFATAKVEQLLLADEAPPPAIRQSPLKLPRMREAKANRRILSRPPLKVRFRRRLRSRMTRPKTPLCGQR